MREKLTAGKIENFSCPEGKQQAFIWDAIVPGFGLKASPGGAKVYVLESRLHGKTLRITIGNVGAWALDGKSGDSQTARAEARRLLGLIDRGIDPRTEKEERRAKAEAARAEQSAKKITALELWNAYVAERRPKWSAAHFADHAKVIQPGGEKRTRGRRPGEPEFTQPGALLPLLSRPLSEIDNQAVKSWLHAESAKRPTHARLCFGLLRAFLNWCSDHPQYSGLANQDACTARVAKETLPKKQAKQDCLQKEQLSIWFAEIRKANPVHAAYLQCVLLTGSRRNELTGLRWADIDFKWASMTIRDKIEGERTIPLTPYVASLLLDLKRRNETPPPTHRILNGRKIENDVAGWEPSPWVFFSPLSESGHIEEPRAAHDRAIKAAGLPHLSIHGLRRSFGTLAEWLECPAGVVAQIQGHKPSATAEKHYRVRPLDLLRVWHTKIEGFILEQAGIQQPTSGTSEAPKLSAVA